MSKAVVNSNNSIFFHSPVKLTINEEAKTSYSTSLKIDTLIRELQEKGPLVAFGYMGPNSYRSEPFLLKNKFGGNEIFGWQPGTRSKSSEKTYAIVIGARKIEDKEYVYFRLSTDCTQDTKTYIREHRLTTDSRVYVSSHQTFRDYLFDMYPPVIEKKNHSNLSFGLSSSDSEEFAPQILGFSGEVNGQGPFTSLKSTRGASKLTESEGEKPKTQVSNFVSSGSTHCSITELEYVIKLVSVMPLGDILGEQENFCKTLGQEIFDKFKKANGGQTSAGKEAVINICNAIKFCAKDGFLRKQYVERAWNGIGDDHWRWHC